MKRSAPRPPAYAANAPDRGRAAPASDPVGEAAGLSPCARSRSAAAPAAAPRASGRFAQRARSLCPYGEHQKHSHQREEDQSGVAPDGEELEVVQTTRRLAER